MIESVLVRGREITSVREGNIFVVIELRVRGIGRLLGVMEESIQVPIGASAMERGG